jgi:hypothetical protein
MLRMGIVEPASEDVTPLMVMKSPFAFTAIVVPETVMVWPGRTVWPATTNEAPLDSV